MVKPVLTLQTKIILLVWTVVAVALFITNMLITRHITYTIETGMGENAINIARLVARSPTIVGGLTGSIAESNIQSLAEAMRQAANVEFIVVLDMNGIRKSHPNPQQIGQHVVGGDESRALRGEEYISIAEGTLGHSLRAFTPVFAPDGRQVGAVVVGILLNSVQQAVQQSKNLVYIATALGLAIGVIGAMLLARSIKKTLFGLEPSAIAKLLEERSAMLQSVHEGIIAVDTNGNITLVNNEALRLLARAGIHGNPLGQSVEEYIPNTKLKDVLRSGQADLGQEQNINGVIILTNRVPVIVNGQIVGAIATFRDKSEVHRLAEELTGVRNYVEALRSQAHEFMNKLHVILGMVRLGCYDQLAAYINQIAHQQQAEVNFVGARIRDHVMAGFLLSKLSRARELGVEMTITATSYLPEPADDNVIHELVTITGNLIDNAFDAVAFAQRKNVSISFDYDAGAELLSITVTDTGKGIAPEYLDKIFAKGFSTKSEDRGLGLALVQRSLDRLGGRVDVETEPGKGARFIARIPYKRAEGVNDDQSAYRGG
ncbi:signal transduction histidine kinase regulating citrate/malate metabolism [Thermosinus carboxydivorans Nor1]|uniref:histidine kinase n=1 Tax=Thermosinus carboxydivorans Nor1 TaxID=401526 RepID=A1HPP4_9FIRM|nr:DcuS/MalK family sensor histidine kinase [Thermosinus carboxydivorans]EAX48014.1 signal transduction histidine kinase regulating citrate/malate metabolism [Thermosinus carboxydivorans Nor1]